MKADQPGPARLSRSKRLLFSLVLLVGVPIGTFIVIEGGSSLLLLARDLTLHDDVLTERRHTDYDSLLGWVNRPNFYDPNLYGPGVYLRTNAERFRNDRDVAPEPPPGRTRVICSGDSFTLGYGVDNAHTWCSRLEAHDPRLETVNMGQGGYGIDQAFLWYRRDGRRLGQAAHVLAIITDDFYRTKRRTFLGFGKPLLVLDGDSLRVTNVPVPRWSYRFPRLATWLNAKRPVMAQLRAAELYARLAPRFSRHDTPAVDSDSLNWLVARRILAELAATDRDEHCTLLVVYLPLAGDRSDTDSDRWRARLDAAAASDGYQFLDLVPRLRAMAFDSVAPLYIPPGKLGHGHLSAAGHDWVAREVARAIFR
ncbi:MAG TPA: hypothetical protein VFW66_11485 [Gemmatimonadales bacterium]|nr:hypothetical protein [Gemmatimonadales bacterium]